MNELLITFDGVCQSVGRRSFVSDLDAIQGPLMIMRKITKISGVYFKARRRDRRRRSAIDQEYRMPNVWDMRRKSEDPCGSGPFTRLCEEILSWLAGKFPLNEDYTYEIWTDSSEGELVLSIGNPGIDLCWDEAAELVEDPENWSQQMGLMIFAVHSIFLGEFVDNDSLADFWGAASDWFRWGVEMPWWLWLPCNWRSDNKKFYRLLEKNDLADIADAFRMAWHDTGKFFLDLEHDDSGYGDDPTLQAYTVENIERLEKLWDEARPIHDRGWMASAQALEHPEIYPTIVRLLGQCIYQVKEKDKQKKLSNKELRALAEENKSRFNSTHSEHSSEDEIEENEDGDH